LQHASRSVQASDRSGPYTLGRSSLLSESHWGLRDFPPPKRKNTREVKFEISIWVVYSAAQALEFASELVAASTISEEPKIERLRNPAFPYSGVRHVIPYKGNYQHPDAASALLVTPSQ